MYETVSESETGQDLPPPSREERDDSYSSGAGRKAKEVPLPEELQGKLHADSTDTGTTNDQDDTAGPFTAPVGTALETFANEFIEER